MRAAVAIALVAAFGGCSRPKATQVVVGLLTDLSVPRQVNIVRLEVDNGGVERFKHDWDFLDSTFELPGTVNLFTDDGSAQRVAATVTAFDYDKVQVTRTAVFDLVKEETRFVRLSLSQRCIGMKCASGSTCIEGTCRPSALDSSAFPVYTTGMEKSLECDSGSVFTRTSTMQRLPVTGTGGCAANEACQEGSCRPVEPGRIVDMGGTSSDGL